MATQNEGRTLVAKGPRERVLKGESCANECNARQGSCGKCDAFVLLIGKTDWISENVWISSSGKESLYPQS